MSRLESNAEPSMEEILASIRKIIAEDSSGVRSHAPPPRPGTPYSPAPRPSTPTSAAPGPVAPRSGFMSREAFLKSSQPVEPEPVKDVPAAPATVRSPPSENNGVSAASRLRLREDISRDAPKPISEKPRAWDESRTAGPITPAPSVANGAARPQAPEPQKARDDSISSKSSTIEAETVEVEPIDDASLPINADARSIGTAKLEPVAESDTARIEAQLTELLSDDLNALRQGRSTSTSGAQAEDEKAKVEEPESRTTETSPPASAPANASAASESSDPFAFDLGPSPFAAKPEPLHPAPSTNGSSYSGSITPIAASVPVERPLPAVEPPKPATPLHGSVLPEPPRADTRPASVEKPASSNGSSYTGPSVPGPANGAAHEPFVAPTRNFEPETPTPTTRQPFGIPSVSATLGPSRKLEPLSNAFQPAPTPPASIPESFSPAAEPDRARVSDYLRASQPPAGQPSQPAFRNPPEDPPARVGLPAKRSESDLDRPMEDAVADLLRPLLKTWLAENMPKIVERALRREITERLLPGDKNSND